MASDLVRREAGLRSAQNVSLDCAYLHIAYLPMIELLRYLEANGFSNHMVSGSGADFMRPISQEVYGIPRQRVIGSTAALATKRSRSRSRTW